MPLWGDDKWDHDTPPIHFQSIIFAFTPGSRLEWWPSSETEVTKRMAIAAVEPNGVDAQ